MEREETRTRMDIRAGNTTSIGNSTVQLARKNRCLPVRHQQTVSIARGEYGGVGPSIVDCRIGKMIRQVLNRALASNNGLHKEA
eukprot:c6633_g1_i1 orf=51-302(+)